jgi:hypothetical protein
MKSNDISAIDIDIIVLLIWLKVKDLIAEDGKRKGLLKKAYFLG